MKQNIKPITDQQKAWIDSRLEEARGFVDEHSPGDAGQPIGIDALQRALAGWLAHDETDSDKITAAVDIVAVMFGRFLERSLGFAWVTVTSGQETELALHGLPGRGDVLIFPQDMVDKRCRKGEKDFLKATYRQIAEHVGILARSPPRDS